MVEWKILVLANFTQTNALALLLVINDHVRVVAVQLNDVLYFSSNLSAFVEGLHSIVLLVIQFEILLRLNECRQQPCTCILYHVRQAGLRPCEGRPAPGTVSHTLHPGDASWLHIKIHLCQGIIGC